MVSARWRGSTVSVDLKRRLSLTWTAGAGASSRALARLPQRTCFGHRQVPIIRSRQWHEALEKLQHARLVRGMPGTFQADEDIAFGQKAQGIDIADGDQHALQVTFWHDTMASQQLNIFTRTISHFQQWLVDERAGHTSSSYVERQLAGVAVSRVEPDRCDLIPLPTVQGQGQRTEREPIHVVGDSPDPAHRGIGRQEVAFDVAEPNVVVVQRGLKAERLLEGDSGHLCLHTNTVPLETGWII